MSDQSKDPKDFPYPLDTDIEEQVPVKRISIDSVDEKTGAARFSVKTVMEKQTVRYMDVPKTKYRCKPGEHVFRVLDKKKGVFGCTLCPFAAKIHPANYMFKDGKLIHRRKGTVV
jgi:hypothetical protein